jgi:hypothetical protein
LRLSSPPPDSVLPPSTKSSAASEGISLGEWSLDAATWCWSELMLLVNVWEADAMRCVRIFWGIISRMDDRASLAFSARALHSTSAV